MLLHNNPGGWAAAMASTEISVQAGLGDDHMIGDERRRPYKGVSVEN